jgi:hypothetical protein
MGRECALGGPEGHEATVQTPMENWTDFNMKDQGRSGKATRRYSRAETQR